MHAWINRKGGDLKEDIVTSCVFGPLRFMKPNHAWVSCLHMFGIQDDCFAKIEPTCVDVRFWPKFIRDDGRGRYVEPDVHIVARCKGQVRRTILIEVKWNSGLSSENQLLDQWKFLSVDGHNRAHIRDCSRHVLLDDQLPGDAEIIEKQKQNCKSWGDHFIEISWYDLAENLKAAEDKLKAEEEVDAWRRDLLLFLSAQGITTFEGFQQCQLACVSQIEWRFEEYTKPYLMATGPLDWNFKKNGVAT